jgi:hypothetical protein
MDVADSGQDALGGAVNVTSRLHAFMQKSFMPARRALNFALGLPDTPLASARCQRSTRQSLVCPRRPVDFIVIQIFLHSYAVLSAFCAAQ